MVPLFEPLFVSLSAVPCRPPHLVNNTIMVSILLLGTRNHPEWALA